MGIRMFCGELGGLLEPNHIAFRADAVRQSISEMYGRRYHGSAEAIFRERWREARKDGWRVVKVEVSKWRPRQ